MARTGSVERSYFKLGPVIPMLIATPPAALKFDKVATANADTLALVAENVITHARVSRGSATSIRRAVRKCRKSRRQKREVQLAMDMGNAAPLTIIRQSSLMEAVRNLRLGQISPEKVIAK